MKQHNMHIPDEDFIPEGLEFREEYMHSALSMYAQARRGLLLKKWIIGTVGIGIVLIASLLIYKAQDSTKNAQVNTIPMKKQEFIQPGQDLSQEMSKGTTDETSDHSTTRISEPESSVSSSALAANEPDNTAVISDLKINSTANNMNPKLISGKLKSDHAATFSSSSNPKTPDKMVLVPENRNPETIPKTKELNDNLVPQFTDENSQIEIVNVITTRQPLQILRPLQPRTGGFIFKDEALAACGMRYIPASCWNAFLTIGLHPFTQYGLSFSQPHLNPALGLGLKYKVCSGATLSAAVEYYSINDLSHPYTIWNSDYGQGSYKSQTTFYTHTLHYGGIHLQSITPLGRRHALLLGYRGSYLITGQNTISKETTLNSESQQAITEKTRGYVQGFRDYNHAISLGYEFRLGTNKSIGLQYSHGLSDITRNEYFGQEYDRNSMFGLYLKMNFK